MTIHIVAAHHKHNDRVSLRRPGTRGTVPDMALAREELARRMRDAKDRSGLTLEQIATQIPGHNGKPTNWRTAQRWFSGQNTPHPNKLNQIAEILGVDPELFQEPHSEHVYDRMNRKLDENARSLNTALGLLDALHRDLAALSSETRERYADLNGATDQIRARLQAIEDRQDEAEALTRSQAEVLRALGASVPRSAEGAPGRARSTRSKKNPGSQDASG